jgi:hypothetical protein
MTTCSSVLYGRLGALVCRDLSEVLECYYKFSGGLGKSTKYGGLFLGAPGACIISTYYSGSSISSYGEDPDEPRISNHSATIRMQSIDPRSCASLLGIWNHAQRGSRNTHKASLKYWRAYGYHLSASGVHSRRTGAYSSSRQRHFFGILTHIPVVLRHKSLSEPPRMYHYGLRLCDILGILQYSDLVLFVDQYRQ